MANYTRDTFFYAGKKYFKDFPDMRGIGVNILDAKYRGKNDWEFTIDGYTYVISKEKAYEYGRKYDLRKVGIRSSLPNIIPVSAFTIKQNLPTIAPQIKMTPSLF